MLAQDIVIKPIITEKSMSGLQNGKYTFKVAKNANKVEIAKAVEELFGVKVAKVNTLNVRGTIKKRMNARITTETARILTYSQNEYGLSSLILK